VITVTGWSVAGIVDRDRHVVSDRAVWPDLVVVSAPMLQLFSGVGKRQEPMSVQALCPELAVERLDETVVGRLAGGEPSTRYWARPTSLAS
jgi:hypothetical protein